MFWTFFIKQINFFGPTEVSMWTENIITVYHNFPTTFSPKQWRLLILNRFLFLVPLFLLGGLLVKTPLSNRQCLKKCIFYEWLYITDSLGKGIKSMTGDEITEDHLWYVRSSYIHVDDTRSVIWVTTFTTLFIYTEDGNSLLMKLPFYKSHLPLYSFINKNSRGYRPTCSVKLLTILIVH